jgi:hypothetical protein
MELSFWARSNAGAYLKTVVPYELFWVVRQDIMEPLKSLTTALLMIPPTCLSARLFHPR